MSPFCGDTISHSAVSRSSPLTWPGPRSTHTTPFKTRANPAVLWGQTRRTPSLAGMGEAVDHPPGSGEIKGDVYLNFILGDMKIYVRPVNTRIPCMFISREGTLSSKCFPTPGIPPFGSHRLEKRRQKEKKWWSRETEGGDLRSGETRASRGRQGRQRRPSTPHAA